MSLEDPLSDRKARGGVLPLTLALALTLLEMLGFAVHSRSMAKSIALLFSGQGAQQVGMGKDLSQQFAVAANRFSAADAALGYSISQIAFDGPIEELTKTSRCQVALYVHGLAVLEVLREQLGNFQILAAAGLSLGNLPRTLWLAPSIS